MARYLVYRDKIYDYYNSEFYTKEDVYIISDNGSKLYVPIGDPEIKLVNTVNELKNILGGK